MVIVVGRVIDQVTVEAAVTDAHLAALLGRHRVRGWVPPGGKVLPGETPRTAVARELAEEAGVASELLPVPAAMAVRSLR